MKYVILMIMAVALAGCNNNKTEYIEVGETLEVEQNVTLECEQPLTVMVTGENEDTNVTFQYKDDNETYISEFGVDISLVVGYPCPDDNVTEMEPEDGVCPDGWEFANDCATVCTPIEEVCLTESLCGDGTYLDENNTCQIDDRPDTGECGRGTKLVDGVCELFFVKS